MRKFVFWLGFAIVAFGLASSANAQSLTVFAAASLKNALDEVSADWKNHGGATVAASYASSSVIAKQIEQGAPADVYISADALWMDYLVKKSLVTKPHDLLSNRLVIVSSKDNALQIDIKPKFDLAKQLGAGRLAVGDPSNVPAGIYAKQALEKLGIWSAIEPKLAPAADVRAALVLVSRGEAPFGIVYQTDAMIDPNVRVAGIFPEDTHLPIRYPVAVVAASHNPDAAKFVAYLDTPAAGAIFQRYGFGIIK